ncbi:MAG: structural protein, partial [Elioraea tepidiphila]
MSADPKLSRGYRNRNPGNIEHLPTNKWLGLETPPSDGRFCRFRSHQHGIRALALLLQSYQDRHGLRTIAGIINRWAPGSENDTAAYIAHVARLTGRDPHERLDLHRHADL